MLQARGYEVQVNRPYAGGFITEHYGNPARGVHALQLEINRALYLDEATLSKNKDFAKLMRTLSDLATKRVRGRCPCCSSVEPPPNRRGLAASWHFILQRNRPAAI